MNADSHVGPHELRRRHLWYGTEGDTRPMALLCRALLCRALIYAGHSAHLLTDAATLGTAAALGVPATGLAGDIRSELRQDTTLAKGGGGFGGTARAFARIATANSKAWLRATVAAAG